MNRAKNCDGAVIGNNDDTIAFGSDESVIDGRD